MKSTSAFPSSASRVRAAAAVVVALGAAACSEPPSQVVRFGAITVVLSADPGEDPFSEATEFAVTVTTDREGDPPKTARAPAGTREIQVPAVQFVATIAIAVEGLDGNLVLSRGTQDSVVPANEPQEVPIVVKRLPGPRRVPNQPTTARSHHLTVPLKDKRTFFVGGCATTVGFPCPAPVAQTEFYDPATAVFLKGPLLPGGRANFGAAVVDARDARDGKEHIFVGCGETAASKADDQIFEIFPGSPPAFVIKLAIGRVGCSLSHLPGTGMLVVAGGRDLAGNSLQTAEMFTPTGVGTAYVAANPPTVQLLVRRAFHSALVLPDGKSILLIGGHDNDPFGSQTTPEVLSQLGSALLPRTVARRRPALFRQPDGTVAIAGVAAAVTVDTDARKVDRYDPVQKVFSLFASLSSPRTDAAAADLGARGIFLAGGKDTAGTALDHAEVVERDKTGVERGKLLETRVGASATPLSDGTVLLVGGRDEPSAERFLP